MNIRWRKVWAPLASLRLTVVLLALSMMLVLMATIAQTELGIWEVMRRYIRTFVVWLQLPDGGPGIPIFPGGWLLGAVLLANLLAAHASRFSLSWKKTPILIIHAGLMILLLSELMTGLFARETQMTLDEGQAAVFTEAPREAELVIMDTSHQEFDEVWSVPESRLRSGALVENDSLPFAIRVHQFFPNAGVAGGGLEPQPRIVTTNGRNTPAATVELIDRDGPAGHWLVSTMFQPQTFERGGRRYAISMRPRRFYKPYSVRLLDFTHEKHPGTEVPRAFSSRVRLRDPGRHEDREVLISMNQPLRYGGETFYQASFANDDRTSILQVVRNPGWPMPYIACAMMTAGLVWQFGATLARRKRRRAAAPHSGETVPAASRGRRISPELPGLPQRGTIAFAAVALLAGFWLLAGLWLRSPEDAPDFRAFGRLPVMADGRLKCFDTLARGALLTMHGKTTLQTPDGGRLAATEWLLTLLARPKSADALPLFVIHEPDILALLKQPPAAKQILSFDQVRPAGAELRVQAQLAEATRREQRSLFQRAILKFDYVFTLYWRLRHSLHMGDPRSLAELIAAHDREIRPVALRMQESPDGRFSDEEVSRVYQAAVQYGVLAGMAQFRPVPYRREFQPRGEWVTLGESLTRSLSARALAPPVLLYEGLLRSFAAGQWRAFNAQAAALQGWMHEYFPEAARRARLEADFNHLNLFVKCAALYLAAFLCISASWLMWPRTLCRLASVLLGVGFAGHTFGLAVRMYIQERPPVTSLYASALFVGWAAVMLGILLERFRRNGFGTAVAALTGFATLIIAHNLTDGDTVEVMRAVLDSNFWLATHVVAITIGYSATFVAGTLGVVYLIGRTWPRAMNREQAGGLSGMIYGVVCFALLFSFVGTLLGGIWADQSWGRFWGWDPKENGALLIVLCHAIFLHLRWGSLAGDRGLAACAVFGNIVGSFSWFGVNMLGVGLHSYGFMDGAPFWLGLFMTSQLAIIGLALARERIAMATA